MSPNGSSMEMTGSRQDGASSLIKRSGLLWERRRKQIANIKKWVLGEGGTGTMDPVRQDFDTELFVTEHICQ